MATRMQQRRGTALQWSTSNPVLAAGEIGFETDTSKFKIGNGSSTWTALTYFANTSGLEALLNDGAPAALNTLNEIAAAINDDPAFFTTIGTQLSNHSTGTTSVHGISNTADLATKTYADTAVSTHSSDTTNIHGISDTAALATQSFVTDAIAGVTGDYSGMGGTGIEWNPATEAFDIEVTIATKEYADSAVTTHNSDTTSVHGIADTSALATTSATASAISTAVSDHNSDTTNVHGISNTANLATTSYADTAVSTAVSALTKSSVGLGNVDNTSDANKPVSTATQTALDLKAPIANPTFTGTVAGVTKTHVGLGNVDNTADVSKPISTATQTALDAKASLAGATFTGSVEIDQNLIVDGNLTVNGTTFNASSTSITIEDNLVQLAHQNSANTVDLGIVVGYNDGTAKHSGLVRDVSEDEWKLFKGVTTEPTTTVNFGQGSLDNLELNNLVAAGVVFTDGTQTKEGVVSRTPIIQKTASYTLSALTERDSLIEVSSSSATTVTIPLNSAVAYPVGTSLDILQTSTGQVTIAGAAGVTVNATPGLKLRTTWSSATLFKRAENTWVVYGDLTA